MSSSLAGEQSLAPEVAMVRAVATSWLAPVSMARSALREAPTSAAHDPMSARISPTKPRRSDARSAVLGRCTRATSTTPAIRTAPAT
jgi:hypothetical protein